MNFNDFNNFNKQKELGQLHMDAVNSAESLARISSEIDEANRAQYEKEVRQINALEQTAKNTSETKERLDTIADNQNDYIKLLKQRLNVQEEQFKLLKEQLDIITSIFMSSENIEEYEKELLELLKEEINDKHSVGDFFKNIGENVLANGTTSAIPVLYNVFKKFLQSKGIMLP